MAKPTYKGIMTTGTTGAAKSAAAKAAGAAAKAAGLAKKPTTAGTTGAAKKATAGTMGLKKAAAPGQLKKAQGLKSANTLTRGYAKKATVKKTGF